MCVLHHFISAARHDFFKGLAETKNTPSQVEKEKHNGSILAQYVKTGIHLNEELQCPVMVLSLE